ncbi:hypothetical protein THARTR1_05368 [Trichoderma harzianum]|uniref:MAPEG family protein n=1 Tax=Trichoderma harzianum TaxID=5544 RepID=A0A2K0U8Q9_TRIHA|nr:hypothetical protein THARTR1_05368 [Trichoderma harzianum]
MSLIADLDLSKNYSFFTVPAAFVLCMLPGAFANALAGKSFDPANPRQTRATVLADDKLDKIQQQRIMRAQSAQENGFETVGLYASGVLAANYAGVNVRMLNLLTIGYLVSRVAYIFAYVVLCQNRKLAPLRSLFWAVGAAILVYLWVMAGQNVNLKL